MRLCFLMHAALTTAHGLHTTCSVLVCHEHSYGLCLHIAVMLQPQNLHIHVHQDFGGKEQLE